MVGDRLGTTRRNTTDTSSEPQRDRGQLILVGAITIAFVILGLVVVFNGVLYAETISSSSTSQSASDAALVETELEQGVAGIVQWENLDGGFTESDLEGILEDENGFGANYRDAKVSSQSVLADVEFGGDATSAAVATDDVLELNMSEDRQIGHLAFALDLDQEDGSIEIEDTAQNEMIEIEHDGVGQCSFPTDAETVVIDVVTGQITPDPGESCEFDTLERGVSSNLLIENNLNADADVVLRGDPDDLGDDLGIEFDDGIWSIDLEVSYQSNEVSYERTQTIDVYGDAT